MKRSRFLLVLVSALALVAASCTSDDEGLATRERDCTWVLGTMGALSGDLSQFDVGIFRGAELAIDRVAEMDLACNVELRSEDSQGNTDQASSLAQSLIEDERLVACVCPYSSDETLAVGRLFTEAGILITGTATDNAISEEGFETWFRAVPRDRLQGPATSAYIDDALGAKAVAVVHDDEDSSKELAESVADDLGDAAMGPFVLSPDETDYSALVSEVEDSDLVYYVGRQASRAPQVLRELRDARVQAQFVSNAAAKDPSFGELAGDAAEGAVVTCPCADPLALETAVEFLDAYRAKYNETPRTFAADLYDVTTLILQALERVDGDSRIDEVRRAVIDFFDDAEALEGAAKTYTWEDSGELMADPLEDVWIYEWSEETADFAPLGPVADLVR